MKPFINIYNETCHNTKSTKDHFNEHSFSTKDRRSNYKKNKDFFNETVEYKHNSYGYRTYTEIEEEYILALGCSHTYGSGLHEHERYTNLLSEQVNIPVINLGVPGSSVNFMLLNFLRLIASSEKKPKILICQCPNVNRLSLPKTNGILTVQSSQKIYKSLYLDDSLHIHSIVCYEILKNIAKKENIKVIDFYFVNSLGGKQIIQEDYARDLDHPGPMTNKKITEYILENL